MNKHLITSMLLVLLLGGSAYSHSGKPDYHVIIDTDGAIDDMRAISMFLADNDIRVLALTSSQGSLMPDTISGKLHTLLEAYHHQGIPVGTGNSIHNRLPDWAPFSRSINWGFTDEREEIQARTGATVVLNNTTKGYDEPLTLIALGSLHTYAQWIKNNPEISGQIERIIWYNEWPVEEGFNYQVSPESYAFIKKSGIPLEIVGNSTSRHPVTEAFLEEISRADVRYADQIIKTHRQPAVKEKIKAGHLQLWDDLVPLYLSAPMLFKTEEVQGVRYATPSSNMPPDVIHESLQKLLASADATNNRVFNEFPVDTSLYKPAYADILEKTIDAYGLEEWKAISMTNEIHGHTGIYSIIGAKMGIRAMEYFNVGVNNLEVISFAGNDPPLSCFNDGMQISTGATIGQGMITIADSISEIPSAIVECNQQRFHFSLKPEIARKMQKEIKHGVKTYGLLTKTYWDYIERLAIDYWADFNRHAIFRIKPIE